MNKKKINKKIRDAVENYVAVEPLTNSINFKMSRFSLKAMRDIELCSKAFRQFDEEK